MGKAARNRRLRKEAHEITAGHPSQTMGVYRRAKKIGNAAAVIEERRVINARRDKKFMKKVRGQ